MLFCRMLFIVVLISTFMALSMFFIYGWHTTLELQEYNFLRSNGYVNLYSMGDYKLNMYRAGNTTSTHKIIGISGLGIDDYGVGMSLVHDELKEDAQFIYIDRAGYGLSEDTKDIQTVDKIVSDYRSVLKEANINPPYILMPHSIGGVYATYWISLYPEEIEGVIYLDGTAIYENMSLDDAEKSTRWDEVFVELSQIGYSRLVYNRYMTCLPDDYSERLQDASEALQNHSLATFAKLSESDEKNSNIITTLENIHKTDIPKVYVSSFAGFRTKEEVKEYFAWPYNKAVSVEYTEARAEKLLAQVQDMREEQLFPYVESLGNTELVYLPGDHLIYLQKPVELANIIREFLYSLDSSATIDLDNAVG